MSEDHTPVTMDNFRGHYNRGTSDEVPKDFLRDTLNLRYSTGEMKSREGSTLSLTLANIVRFHPYKRLNENPRYLILDSVGNLYDSLSLGAPIHSNSSWVDFSLLNFNNLAYISPHNRVNGITGQKLWVYDGSTFRLAAGAAPTSFSMTAADSPSATGHVEEGTHLFTVVFETSSGFLTPPPDSTLITQWLTQGGHEVILSGIPLGPSGTVARRILATRVLPNFDGNRLGATYYFVPNGRIADNTTTTLNVSFYDVELFDSADYLFDQFDLIPAGLGLIDYNGRIALWGIPGSEHVIYLSKSISPESFDRINGFVTCYPSDNASGIKGCWAQRGNLFIRKAGTTYQVADNAQNPVTWVPNRVDDGIGGEVFCGSTIIDKDGASSDKMFIAHISGLYAFGGAYFKPALSFNIENEWKRINKSKFNLVNVVHDPNSNSIYVAVPLDSATSLSHIFYCDYSEALDPIGFIIPKDCKWSIWQFPEAIAHILADYDNNNNVLFKYSPTSGNIYYLDTSVHNDYSNVIHSYGISYLVGDESEFVSHFDQIRIRVKGSGQLLLTLYGEDEVVSLAPLAITMASAPGKPTNRKINFHSERMSVKMEVNSAGDWFNINRLIVFASEEFAERPS